MNTIIERLCDLGFIIKGPLKVGKNRVPTIHKPRHLNGEILITDKYIKYSSWDESIESGYISDNNILKNLNIVNLGYVIEDKNTRIKNIKAKWESLCIINDSKHPYLTRKHSILDNKIKIFNDRLCIPIYNLSNLQIEGIQYIFEDGEKRFEPGSVLSRNGFFLGEFKREDVLLCEGYATASSIYLATQLTTIVCFSCQNVDRVAKNFNNPIVIKDNDQAGMSIKTNGFTLGINGEDANDIHLKYGLSHLRKEIFKKLCG